MNNVTLSSLVTLVFVLSTQSMHVIGDDFAINNEYCDGEHSVCAVREPCHLDEVYCPDQKSHHRGAVYDNNKTVQLPVKVLDENRLPENGERLLDTRNFQFWGLPELPEEIIYVEKSVVAVEERTVAKQIATDIEPIRFESGRSYIPEQYILRIGEVLESLKARNKLRLHFIGHTDNVGLSARARARYGDNAGLSLSRAKEVAQLFESQLDLSEIETTWDGKGEQEPVASNGSEEGRARNRRVEIQVWFEEKEQVTEEVNSTVKVPQVLDSIRTVVCANEERGSGDSFNPDYDPLDHVAPFRITIDGEPLETSSLENNTATHSADIQRCTDVALEKTSVQIQYDNLLMKPQLSIAAWPGVIAFNDDPKTEFVENTLSFVGFSNYQAFWQRAEVRVFGAEQSLRSEPLATIPLDAAMRGTWTYDLPQPEHLRRASSALKFVLRVYDETRFDETQPQYIGVRQTLDDAIDEAHMLAGAYNKIYSENHVLVQNIPIRGGSVTVNGEDVPGDHHVHVMGYEVPADEQGKFVYQQIIPQGYQTVEVAILDNEGAGHLFHRDLLFAESDWFYVGIADLTVGWRDTNGPASEVTQDDRYDDDNFAEGRLAFYLKGKTKSAWDITASADTRELPIKDLFTNFTNKDPTVLFRRLDPDYYYPTFGDDSTLEEGAPTQGKFYFKAEKNKNFGLWGNFETNIQDTELARIDRGLYGAQGHYESPAATPFGEKKTQADLFVAEPGTVGAREEFRGTGGSLYFLRHQNITLGSERVRVEVRDKDTDLVVQRRRLVAGSDYDIDPIQGRIILSSPLSASSRDGLLVRDGSIAGNENFLVVSYEYTPGFEELDDVVIGGRVSQWLGNNIKLGVTANEQEQTGIDQTLLGADVTLRSNSGNYIKFEVAETEGLTTDQFESFDGGFDFNDTQAGVLTGEEAKAARVETAFKLGRGSRVSAFYQTREAGFSSTGQFVDRDTDQYGLNVNTFLTKNINLNTKLAAREQEEGQQTKTLDAIAEFSLNKHWHIDAGIRYDKEENDNPAIPLQIDQGERTDATVELGYSSNKDWQGFVFAQGTLDREDTRDTNNRVGVGGVYKVNDKLDIDAEVSNGNTGTGARVGTDYIVSDATNLYLSFALENERAGNSSALRGRRGNVTSGFKTRYTDTISLYGEERYAYGDQPTGLTHLYGVDFAPTSAWSIGVSIETGELENATGETIERLALGGSLGYSKERIQYAGGIEYRNDKSAGNERKTWLLRNELTYKNSDNWRTVGKLNYSQSDSSQGEFFDGDFTEAIWGYAYRPIDNDRLNALFKYTYFFNKPAPEQVSTRNINSEFIQRSHILSADANYDISPQWTIGAKYAFRRGELALDRIDPNFFRSDAHLIVLRADWHLVKYWDFLVEGRTLELPDASDNRAGFLIGAYRHVGANLKIGLGYNFTDFSDDLTDLSFDSQGVFINIVGKL